MLGFDRQNFVRIFAGWAVAVMLGAVGSSTALAQLPQVKLYAVYPTGGQAGTNFDLTVTNGADLEEIDKLLFSQPGITAVPKMNGQARVANAFVVTIADYVPAGLCEVRVGGKFGVSNPRTFVVGKRKEFHEAEANNTREQATAIELNSVANGRSNGNSDVDFFKFSAKKGQRFLAGIQAVQIDSKMSPVLELYGPGGRLLTSAYDNRRGDALVDHTPAADGEYMLKVYDFVFAGSNDYVYRLDVHAAPHVDFVLPPAAVAGTESDFTLYGRNLPGGQPAGKLADGSQLQKLGVRIKLPADSASLGLAENVFANAAGVDGFSYVLNTPQGDSNPVLIQFAQAIVSLETEPNNEPAQANKLTVPGEFSGQFGQRGDIDFVTFDAKAKQTYWIEVFGQRHGSSVDPYVLIDLVTKDAKGVENVKRIATLDDSAANVGGATFNTISDDPVYKLVAPADATYRVSLRDRYFEARGSAELVYRLAIRNERPDFRLVALPVAPQQNAAAAGTTSALGLRRGENFAVNVMAFRRDGFAGAIDLSAEGLPPGVTCNAASIDGTQTSTTLIFTSAADAPVGFANARIIGRARVEDPRKVRARVDAAATAKTATAAIPNLDKAIAQATPPAQKTEQATTAAEKVTADALKKQQDAKAKADAAAKALADAQKTAQEPAIAAAQKAKAAADAALAQADKALQQAKQTSDKAVVAHNAAAEKLKQAQTARAAGQQAIDQANAALTAAQKAQQDAIREVQRLARVATVAWPAAGTVSPIGRLARTLAVSVQKETAPFQVVAEVPPRFEVNQSRQIVVPVKLLKRDGFDNAVTLTWVGQPKTVQIKNEPIAKGKAEGLYRIFVPNNAPVGTYTLYLRAQGQVSYRRNVELADAAKAEQAKADAAAKAADAALKSATPARVAADKKAADDANKAKAADAARKKAEQNAKNSAAALKKATDAQTAATKKVTDATNAAKDAEAKNKAAQEAAAKDANLKPQADAAAKTLADAQAALPKLQKEKQTADAAQVKAKQASDATATALANADKTLKDAQTASKTSTDAKTKAAAVVTAATASKKTVDAAKKAADQKLAAANKAAAAKNINIFPPSTPIVVQIKPGPATLAAAVPDGGKIKRGQKVDVKVTVKRLNGFAGPLTLTLPLPPGVAGLTAAPVTIPADKSEAVLSIQAAADATEGQLANLVIRATMEFQGKAAVDQAVALNVSK